jgi:PAS domain S-box-containing protein
MITALTNPVISINELWGFYNLSEGLFFILSPAGIIKSANPSVSDILGYTEDQLINRQCLEFVHPDDLLVSREKLKNISSGEPVISFTVRLLTANGNYKWISLTGNLGKDNNVYAFGNDCTDKMVLEEEMQKLSVITQKMQLPLIVTDEDRKIIWVNEAFTNVMGYSVTEAIGQNETELLFGPLTSKNIEAQIFKSIKARLPFVKKIITYKKNGDPFWVQVESQPLFDTKSNMFNWFSLYTDISEQVNTEQALEICEKKYNSIFNNNPLPQIIYDRQTKEILEVNKAAIQQYEHGIEEFLELKIHDLEKDKLSDNETTQMLCTLKAGKMFNIKCKHVTKSRKVLRIEASFSAIDYKNGTAVLAILKDVTENFNHKQKVLDQSDCLQDIAWKQSHLLRRPLANLKSLIIFVKEDPTNTMFLQYMETELERLDSVVKEMVTETSGLMVTKTQNSYC